jgi:hypothetical protein
MGVGEAPASRRGSALSGAHISTLVHGEPPNRDGLPRAPVLAASDLALEGLTTMTTTSRTLLT